jgi:hypothetical protein
LAEALLIQGRASIVLRKHTLEGGVVALHGLHGVVHDPADGGLPGVVLEM